MSNPRINKRQRELDKKARADRKRERRIERVADAPETRDPSAPVDEQRTLAALAKLHEAYEAHTISFEDFETAKQELTSQLDI